MDRKEFIKKSESFEFQIFYLIQMALAVMMKDFALLRQEKNGMFIIQKEAVKLQMNFLTLKAMH